MQIVEPAKTTHTAETTSNKLIIEIPMRKHWGWIIWLLLCFVVASFALYYFTSMIGELLLISIGLINIPSEVLEEMRYPPDFIGILLIPFFILLTTELLVVFALLWRSAGKEIITIDQQNLVITRQLLGWKRSRRYSLSNILEVGMARSSVNWFLTFARFQRLMGFTGTISFDYGAKEYLFGCELDQAEARQIISKINGRITSQKATSNLTPR